MNFFSNFIFYCFQWACYFACQLPRFEMAVVWLINYLCIYIKFLLVWQIENSFKMLNDKNLSTLFMIWQRCSILCPPPPPIGIWLQ